MSSQKCEFIGEGGKGGVGLIGEGGGVRWGEEGGKCEL